MRHEMKHVFEETIQDIERILKDLIREYETAAGGMAREIGPLVYGYSYSVGADGKPQFREFGNIRPLQRSLRAGAFGGCYYHQQRGKSYGRDAGHYKTGH